jgi:general secretion pathway protein F
MLKYYNVEILYRGEKIREFFESRSKQELYNEVFNQYPKCKILKIDETSKPSDLSLDDITYKVIDFLQLNRIDEETKIFFLNQLAVMIDAGISILDSLREIRKSVSDRNLINIIDSINTDINNGSSLSEAFEKFETIFGNLTITMMKLGDKTGDSAKAIFKLVTMLEEIRDNKTKVKKAMSYPRNVIIAMIIAMTVIINYVIPKFKSIFDRFNSDLPILTQILIGAEKFFSSYGIYIFIFGLFLFLVFNYFMNNSERFKHMIHFLMLKTYIIKDIALYSTLNRFTVVFAELLNAGISIFEALEISISMVDNLVLREKLLRSYAEINRGSPLYKSFEGTGIFDNMVIQMIYTGESSGELQKMLNSISDFYKRKFSKIIENMHSLLEPIILLFIGALVTTLALGIFMPIWSLGEISKG